MKNTLWSKDFILLALGKLVSLLGSNIQQFALALYVYDRTKSPTLFGLLLAISALPRLLLSPVAGVCGDWFDRKKSIVFFDLLNGVIIGAVFILMIFKPKIPLVFIFALIILLEITEIFFGASMAAVLPSIVDKDNLGKANSVMAFNSSLGSICAPIIGAFLYGAFGIKFIFLINAFSFVASSITETFINVPKSHNTPEKINISAFKDDLIAGLNVIKDNKDLPMIMGLSTILNFCLNAVFSVGLIYMLRETLKVSDVEFGIAQSAMAATMLLGPFFAGIAMKRSTLSKIMINGFLSIGLLIISMGVIVTTQFLGVSPSYFISYIGIIAMTGSIGVIVTVSNISLITAFQKMVPLEYMGRVGATFSMLVTIAVPVGQLLFGALLEWIHVSLLVMFMGSIFLAAILIYRKALLSMDIEKQAAESTEAL